MYNFTAYLKCLSLALGLSLVFNKTNAQQLSSSLTIEKFSATKRIDGAVLIHWISTSSETPQYVVEHSLDGINFKPTEEGFIQRHSDTGIDYEFLHKGAINGINYYRLKTLAEDGSQLFSDIISVVIHTKKTDLGIFPNPAIGQAHLLLDAKEGEDLKVAVSDVSGKEIATRLIKSKNQRADLDLDELERGMYSITVYKANGQLLKGRLLVAF